MGDCLARAATEYADLLCSLVNKPDENKPLLCIVASMLLKSRCRSMSLVQRALSVVLYGNGVGKKVHVLPECILV